MKTIPIALALLVVFIAGATSAFGQITGSITGAVVDQSGAAIPNAKVNLFLPGGAKPILATQTTAEGLFTVSAVRPDTYRLEVEAKGFNKTTVEAVRVSPATAVAVPQIKMEIASAAQSVLVAESYASVQLATSEVTQTVSQTQLDNLPILDRQITTMFITQPGVTNSRTNTSVNGMRPSYTNVLLDGVNIQDSVRTNDLDYLPSKLTIGQVEELTISTSNADPTIGGNASTVVLTTASGTNEYHGNGYWFNRNSHFAANNWFNNKNGVERPFENLNQIGGSIGGPIVKDKLLFNANYEAYRDKQKSPTDTVILTPEARQGIFRYNTSSGVRSFNVLTPRQLSSDPFIQGLLAKTPTAGNNSSYGDGLNTTGYSFNARSNETRDNVQGKVDYYLSTKHAFSGTFGYNRDIVDRPDSGTFFTVVPPVYNDSSQKFMSASWRWSPKSTWTNEVRGGFSLQPGTFKSRQADPDFLVSSALSVPTSANMMLFTSPLNATRPEGRFVNSYAIQDNATWVRGKHSFFFGFQSALLHVKQYGYGGTIPAYTLGLSVSSPYGFSTGDIPGASSTDIAYANALLATMGGIITSDSRTFNAVSRTSGFVPGAATTQRYKIDYSAPYFSDRWKIRRNLTLTLGLRWNYFAPVEEAGGLLVQPRADNGNTVQALLGNSTLDFAGSAVGRPLSKKDLNNFAPTVGFAWDVFGDGKTAVRGAYSIAPGVDNNLNSIYNATAANTGLVATISAANLNNIISRDRPQIQPPPFRIPTTAQDVFNLSPTSPPAQGMIDPNLVIPYVQQWNFSIERDVKGFVLTGRYVGNHVVKMFRQIDFNQVNVNQEGFLQDFIKARSNGFLALNTSGRFDPRYNSSIAGSQTLPFFDRLPAGGSLTASSVSTAIRGGEIGTLAQTYQGAFYFPHDGFSYFPSPYVLYSSLFTNYSNSTFNALELEMAKRTKQGLELKANYTFSKVLSDALATRGLEALLDNNSPSIEKARAPFDVTHSFKLTHYAPLPFGPGQRFDFANKALNRIAEGWAVSGFLHIDSGPPVSILSALGTLNRGARSGNNTVDTTANLETLKQASGLIMTGNGPYFIDPSHIGSDGRGMAPDGQAPFSGQLFFKPQPGTLGSLQRRILSGPWYKNYNFNLNKNTKITERQSVELRAAFYNLFNHPNFFVGDQNITSASFGRITSLLYSGEGTGMRAVQFGLYYKF